MSSCGQKSMYVIHSLIPSPPTVHGSVRPGRRGLRKGTYKGRLNLDNEMRLLTVISVLITMVALKKNEPEA